MVLNKILIANRGEIALRIARTTRAMGYRTVALYSDAEREMPYVTFADEAVAICGASAALAVGTSAKLEPRRKFVLVFHAIHNPSTATVKENCA